MTGALSIAAGLGVLLIVFAAGCESSQDKSARLAKQAVPLKEQQGVARSRRPTRTCACSARP